MSDPPASGTVPPVPCPPLPATEGTDPRYLHLAEWPSEVALDALLEAQLAAVAAVRPALAAIAAAADEAATRLRRGGRLIYCGAGTSGRIGVQDGAELPPTFNWPRNRLALLIAGGNQALTEAVENAEDRTDQAASDIATLAPTVDDVLIAIAASGATPYPLACLRLAAQAGALTIAVANSAGAPLLAAAAHPILLETGAEPVAGSTRLKAGTSQKVALNLLSTTIMLRLGHVYRGQMVDMQARNEKLRGRAVRMVRGLTGCSDAAARDSLAATDGQVKAAILVVHGVMPEDAFARLQDNEGDLGAVLRGREGGKDGLLFWKKEAKNF